ncbi:MAG: hypothetical protein IPG50_14370 [Myxococcales bacterium]|nr:hypothetical protein [Myxococcales bacterium]
MSAAAARWDGFLKQIADRHAAVCQEAEEGSKAALAACGHDFIPISHAWMAVNDRLKELERRIIDTWNEKVEAVFEQEGVERGVQMRERRKGEDLAFDLENKREASEMRTFAAGARELHQRALVTQAERNCGHCGVPLAIPVTYRAINVTCTHCQSVVTFEPATLARMAIASGGHAMAWEAAYPEWLQMRRAERPFATTGRRPRSRSSRPTSRRRSPTGPSTSGPRPTSSRSSATSRTRCARGCSSGGRK